MTTMTHSVREFPDVRHSVVITGAMIVLFWIAAATAITGEHLMLDRITPVGATAAKIATIIVAAYAYIRFTARRCTVDQALFVGIAWVLLDIATEITTTVHTGRGWHELLGSPSTPALRDMLLFSWVIAPAAFARYRCEERKV